MSAGTNVSLTSLISKIRKLTARPSQNQIDDDEVIDYINKYYELEFPQELKTVDLKTTYKFYTTAGVDQYALSSYSTVSPARINGQINLYKSFEPPVYVSGYEARWYLDRETFYRYFPDMTTSMQLAVATGAAGPFSGNLTSGPVLRKSLMVSTETTPGTSRYALDNGIGGFVDENGVSLAGSINYTTGSVTGLFFNGATTAGSAITARWVIYAAAKPYACLFFDNTFILRPVPDGAYEVTVQAYFKPTALYLANQEPGLAEWFDLLAYGTSLKIFVDSLEMESYQALFPIYKQQLDKAERKSIMTIKSQRTKTIYSENNDSFSYRYPTY